MIPDQVSITESVFITGSVSDSNSNVTISIFLVINDDCFELKDVQSSMSQGSFDFLMSIRSLYVPGGFYRLSFYAVDSIGCVSPGVHFNVTILAPTESKSPTGSKSPTESKSPPESKSPTESKSRSRTATVARSTVAFSRSQSVRIETSGNPSFSAHLASSPTHNQTFQLWKSAVFQRSGSYQSGGVSSSTPHPGNEAGEGRSGFPIPIVAGAGGGAVVLAAVSWIVYRIHKGHAPSVQDDVDKGRGDEMDEPEIALDDPCEDTIATGTGLDTYLDDDFTAGSKCRDVVRNDVFGLSDADVNDIESMTVF
jgi:hypothetical protein